MPLVLMCGFPSSGKTVRANELSDYLKNKHNLCVEIIGDEHQTIDKNGVYADSKMEKVFRGNLKSATQRGLNKDTVIILDSLNYIKGFRYELFCVCKSARTTLSVIFCDVLPETAHQFNGERSEKEQYTSEILDALVMRFEAPNPQNRWDSPLFITRPGEDLNVEAIHSALYLQKAPPPNMSTQSQPLAATNYLHELDKITQEIVALIMDAQKMWVTGDVIPVPGAQEKILVFKTFTLGELQRCRRQFIIFTKSQAVYNVSKISNMFVMYLNKSLQ